MKYTDASKRVVRVAVPYYGSLIRPNMGLEKVYFVADVDIDAQSLKNLSVKVWNPKIKRELPDWIKKGGISGIICSDGSISFENYFNTKNIWVSWGQKGDVTDVIEQWVQQHPRHKNKQDITTRHGGDNEQESKLQSFNG